MLYLFEQCLNGMQLGMLLFLLAAGLTLIFGIMDLVNLAHGSLYMLGAYFAATFVGADRQLRRRHRARAGRDAHRRHGAGGDRDPAALRARSSRPRARHLRAADLLQRAGAADLGAGRADHSAAVADAHRRAGDAGRLLSRSIAWSSSWRRSRSRCCFTFW